jgi:type I restriction enzyme S subunit
LRNQATREAATIELACFHDSLMDGLQSRGWPVLMLGDVAKSFQYGTSAKAHSEAKGLPVIRMGNLQGGSLDLSDLKYIDLPPKDVARYKLRVGDVLINRTNSLELVGKAATFSVERGVWVFASYLVRVEIDRERVMPEFVTSVINSSLGRDYVLRTARRAIGMVNLNAKEMAKFPIPVPSLDEQKEIVARLMAARRLGDELRESMANPEIRLLRQSILQRAFAGEL